MKQSGTARRRTQSKQYLSLWLRMLGCESAVENHLRSRLRERFGVTLPQFDVLAKLDYTKQPQTMTELSNQLMVSNGNVTGVVDSLVREGHVKRASSPDDRRVQLIALTDTGKQLFDDMAGEHEKWISELFSPMSQDDACKMSALLESMLENLNKHN